MILFAVDHAYCGQNRSMNESNKLNSIGSQLRSLQVIAVGNHH